MTANTVQTRKAKGRVHQQRIVQAIREAFNLADSDVESTSMGASGMDVKLSAAARKAFPFSVEAKCQEKLSWWAAWFQCVDNTEEGLHPALIVKRNRSPVLAVIEFDVLLDLMRKINE